MQQCNPTNMQQSLNLSTVTLKILFCVQWTLRITDTLVHRLLSFIRGKSFIGVFYFSHLPRHLILIL